MEKPVAEACLRNQAPIAETLSHILTEPARVLEIGSGTGQHAVYISARLPHLTWQPSELAVNLPGIRAWMQDVRLPNVLEPLVLDMGGADWPTQVYDAVFTANTVHFVGWHLVDAMLDGVAGVLKPGGLFCVYGPFNYDRQYTSPGNQQLDLWLKSRDPESGIKDIAALCQHAQARGLQLRQDEVMPANNRLLVFVRD